MAAMGKGKAIVKEGESSGAKVEKRCGAFFLHSLRLEPQLKKTFPDRIGATSIDTEEGIGVTDQRRLNASSFSTPHEPDLHRAFTLSGQA